jgi:hypothetical protein
LGCMRSYSKIPRQPSGRLRRSFKCKKFVIALFFFSPWKGEEFFASRAKI